MARGRVQLRQEEQDRTGGGRGSKRELEEVEKCNLRGVSGFGLRVRMILTFSETIFCNGHGV